MDRLVYSESPENILVGEREQEVLVQGASRLCIEVWTEWAPSVY